MRDPNRIRNDRPVDRFRNAGGRGDIEGDVGPIVTMFSLNQERIYFIAERGVTSAQMADQIDPDRLNPALPNMIQRPELSYGSTTPFVARTICLGASLFDQTYLPASVSKDTACSLALEAAANLAEIQDNITALAASEAGVRRKIYARELKLHVLPRTPNLKGRVDGSINGLRSVVVTIQKLAELFYPKTKATDKFTPTLRSALIAKIEIDDPRWPTVEWCFAQLEKFSDYRAAMIHNDGEKRLITKDYDLEADGTMIAPTIEVIHPANPLPRVDVVRFLTDALEAISRVFEAISIIMCDTKADLRHLGLRTFVIEDERDIGRGTRIRWQSEWLEGFPKMLSQSEPKPHGHQ